MSRSDNTPPPVERGTKVNYCLRSTAKISPCTELSRRSQGAKVPRTLRREIEAIHVRAYTAPNWFTVAGVRLKRKLIENKGLPTMKDWRFITLTINPDLFESPLSAYLTGRDSMRDFMENCRKSGLWTQDDCGFWKLEFQSNGWPHWHLCVSRRHKFSQDEMNTLTKLWRFGRTNVERITENDFGYTFKYAFKAVAVEEDEQDPDAGQSLAVPDWFLDYAEPGKDGKLKTFYRARFFQTFGKFYTGKPPAPSAGGEPESCMVPLTVRQVVDNLNSKVQVVSRSSAGFYKASAVIILSITISRFWDLVGWDAVNGGAVGLAVNSFVTPAHIITRNTSETWKLDQLRQQNQLTLKQAARLQQRGETLRTC